LTQGRGGKPWKRRQDQKRPKFSSKWKKKTRGLGLPRGESGKFPGLVSRLGRGPGHKREVKTVTEIKANFSFGG